MIEIVEKVPVPYNLQLLEAIAKKLTKRDLELIIVDAPSMQQLNKHHFGKDYPTDVLSFPLEPIPHAPLGSIVINAAKVREGAKRYGHSEEEEFTLLFIHGLLHLLGYDHETDQGQMRQKEAQLIEAFDLPKSLIIRNES